MLELGRANLHLFLVFDLKNHHLLLKVLNLADLDRFYTQILTYFTGKPLERSLCVEMGAHGCWRGSSGKSRIWLQVSDQVQLRHGLFGRGIELN